MAFGESKKKKTFKIVFSRGGIFYVCGGLVLKTVVMKSKHTNIMLWYCGYCTMLIMLNPKLLISVSFIVAPVFHA